MLGAAGAPLIEKFLVRRLSANLRTLIRSACEPGSMRETARSRSMFKSEPVADSDAACCAAAVEAPDGSKAAARSRAFKGFNVIAHLPKNRAGAGFETSDRLRGRMMDSSIGVGPQCSGFHRHSHVARGEQLSVACGYPQNVCAGCTESRL